MNSDQHHRSASQFVVPFVSDHGGELGIAEHIDDVAREVCRGASEPGDKGDSPSGYEGDRPPVDDRGSGRAAQPIGEPTVGATTMAGDTTGLRRRVMSARTIGDRVWFPFVQAKRTREFIDPS
jgi:hypothetical protein